MMGTHQHSKQAHLVRTSFAAWWAVMRNRRGLPPLMARPARRYSVETWCLFGLVNAVVAVGLLHAYGIVPASVLRVSVLSWCAAWPVLCVVLLVRVHILLRRMRTTIQRSAYALCPNCGYSLVGLPREHTCPECGYKYDLVEVEAQWRRWFPEK